MIFLFKFFDPGKVNFGANQIWTNFRILNSFEFDGWTLGLLMVVLGKWIQPNWGLPSRSKKPVTVDVMNRQDLTWSIYKPIFPQDPISLISLVFSDTLAHSSLSTSLFPPAHCLPFCRDLPFRWALHLGRVSLSLAATTRSRGGGVQSACLRDL
jgi:hypothetical protein